jgi:hypothetical protein
VKSCSSESNRALGCTGPARHHLRLSSTCAVVAFDSNVTPRALTTPTDSIFDGTSRRDDLLTVSTVLELNQSLSLGRRGPNRSDNGAIPDLGRLSWTPRARGQPESGWRGSNPRTLTWHASAEPAQLHPHLRRDRESHPTGQGCNLLPLLLGHLVVEERGGPAPQAPKWAPFA